MTAHDFHKQMLAGGNKTVDQLAKLCRVDDLQFIDGEAPQDWKPWA